MFSVDDPEPPDMLLALRVGVRPVTGTVDVNVTVPVKPLTGAMVIVDVPELPAWIVKVAGFEVTVKLGVDDVMVKAVVWVSDPPIPVTLTVNVPAAEAVHDKVAVPLLVKLEEVRLHVIPVDGEAVSVSETALVNPLRNDTEIVEAAANPVETDALEGLLVRLKSSSV